LNSLWQVLPKVQTLQNYDQICSDINEGKFAPIYFLSGVEPFFIDRIAQLIEQNALEEGQKDFNLIVGYGRDSKIQDILVNARKFPVMAERQVVIVREAQDMMDWLSKDRVNDLLVYIKHNSPSTILVFCYKYKTLSAKSPLRKPIEKFGVLLETKKIWDNQVPKYIKGMLREEGLKLSEKAVDVLFELVGNDIERLHNEIQKLKLVEDHEEEIDEIMVGKYIGLSNPFSIIDLHKAIAHRRADKALEMAFEMYSSEKSEILPLIASLYRFFTKILEAHQSGKRDPNGIQAALKINFYQAQDMAAAVNNYPLPKVLEFFDFLLEADKSVKGVSESQSNPHQIVQELFAKIFL
jgi:DNA polymerase III subunit delta